jgi:HEAT repeat protein
MRLSIVASRFTLALASAALTFAGESPPHSVAERARRVLADALATEKAFVKVHAAEALIALGEVESPRRVFQAELPATERERPYRIGVWRVLALSSPTRDERARWIEHIEAVVLDDAAMDQLHAIETLGKLRHRPAAAVRRAVEHYVQKAKAADVVFARWVLHLAGDHTALPAIIAALESQDPAVRSRAAYVLQALNITDAGARRALARAAEREPPAAAGYANVLSAAVKLEADPNLMRGWITALEEVVASGSTGARYQACQALMLRYTPEDLHRLVPLLDHPDGDARIGAAWAILHVIARTAGG